MIKVIDGQTYELVDTNAHTRRDGSETFLLIWRTHCAECNEPFLTQTPGMSRGFSPARRCGVHKRPGQRVKRPVLSLDRGASQ